PRHEADESGAEQQHRRGLRRLSDRRGIAELQVENEVGCGEARAGAAGIGDAPEQEYITGRIELATRREELVVDTAEAEDVRGLVAERILEELQVGEPARAVARCARQRLRPEVSRECKLLCLGHVENDRIVCNRAGPSAAARTEVPAHRDKPVS